MQVTTTLLRQNAPLVARSTPAAAAASLALTSGVADQVKQEVARIPALPTPSAGRLTSAQDVTSAFSPRLMGHLFVIAGAANCVGQCITNPIDVEQKIPRSKSLKSIENVFFELKIVQFFISIVNFGVIRSSKRVCKWRAAQNSHRISSTAEFTMRFAAR